MNKTIAILLILLGSATMHAQQTSVAGMYPMEHSGRIVYNFNQGWRFMLGDAEGAEAVAFDDSKWEVVCTPHTSRLEPSEASGCRNYQGISWYRKQFNVPSDLQGKHITVHFEAVMGKQLIYVNGRLVSNHLGGYQPITINLTQEGVKAGDKCLIAVKADNSDDKNYPPGKKQSALDFAYHGGMYRDVWLIGKSDIAITDAIERNKVGGGGVFIHYGNISEKSADVYIDVEVGSRAARKFSPVIIARIKDADGRLVKTAKGSVTIPAEPSSPKGTYLMEQQIPAATATMKISLPHPHLWSPESPYLYKVELQVMNGKETVDGGMVRMGIRKAEFRGKDGFWLNGKPYRQLVGGNRHQDFAYVGNALPNSQQWRDAKRLKDAGMNIIRAAHYPQDPSFMDACDELGIFIIVPTPGWQYWNKEEGWADLVHQNTREIIRRDRNHPCVLMWEPILNETRYPEDFALQALQITREEYPYPGRPVAAADMHSAGVKDHYDVLYGWPEDMDNPELGTDKCIFTREFGEMVDDWYAHNCINRAARFWGEKPMLTAALSLADTYGTMFHGQRQFIGGCQWHPFDHQRGYHPDPYLGGIYDAFRQKKYAVEMFASQAIPNSGKTLSEAEAEVKPMLFVAHEMTQFSDNDVVVFSNCDSIRLTQFEGDKQLTLPVVHQADGLPNAPVVFKDFWDFWKARDYSYKQRNWQKVSLLAEGIKDGKVVCTEKKMPARRSTKLRLYADEMGKPLVADGSDFIVVVAEVTDDNGHVRRLAKDNILFTVEGEGSLIGDASILANPRVVEWGSAPALVRSTNKAGKITITARSAFEGNYAPTADTLTIESIPYDGKMCYEILPEASSNRLAQPLRNDTRMNPKQTMTEEERRKTLNEVEEQQKEFGVK